MDASLLIIGAGPAGLWAAWTAARHKPPGGILVVDRLDAPGIKLAVTGGGRGNLSHLATEGEFTAAFGRNGRFTLPAFRALPPDKLRADLAHIGIPSKVDAEGRVYPTSQSASQVRDALATACERTGVRFLFNHRVTRLVPPNGPGQLWHADALSARMVLLAAGGQSAATLGSDGSGFALAKAAGYDIVTPVPALVSLHTVEKWPAEHSGLSLPEVEIHLAGMHKAKHQERGALLFTHHGISGPAVLNLSGFVARLLAEGKPVGLELALPGEKPDFQQLRHAAGTRTVLTWLAGRIPRTLARTVLHLSGIQPEQTFARLTISQIQVLSRNLSALPLTISGTGGFAESMATSGGVSLKQVHPETLEGRLLSGLFFAGEILNLDGPTGGWNLHWAFCSGHLAGTRAAQAAGPGFSPCAGSAQHLCS